MIKIKLTQDFILESEQSINFKVNTFYEKNIYYSSNISNPINQTYQLGGDLNGTPANLWKEESLLTDFFIISEEDFENINNNIYSEEVKYIEKLMNKHQTIIDSKNNIISSKIKILRFNTFLMYINNRRNNFYSKP